MDYSNYYPEKDKDSKLLKADDFPAGRFQLEIESHELAKFSDDEQKVVIHFVGQEKGLTLNPTNFSRIVHGFGSNANEWIGKEIILSSVPMDKPFRGYTNMFLVEPAHPVQSGLPPTQSDQPMANSESAAPDAQPKF